MCISFGLHSRVHLRSELPVSVLLPSPFKLRFGFVHRILGVGDVGDVVFVAHVLWRMHFILAVPKCRSDCLSFGRRTLPN